MWEVALLVRERESDLDDLEEVDITPHGLVVVVRRRLEAPYRSRHDSWKLGVLYTHGASALLLREQQRRSPDHADERELVHQVPDDRHFGVEVVPPYVDDLGSRHLVELLELGGGV